MVNKDILESAVKALEDCGNDNARFDAAQLFEKAFGVKYELTSKSAPADEKAAGLFNEYITKRCEGYPLQYILGEWEFYGLPVKVGEGVLIPRQDTETLVETVIRKNRTPDPLIIDLCSGSGCIALALEKELSAKEVHAVEMSEKAAGYLRENITLNRSNVRLTVGDCLDSEVISHLPKADIIVCNPPYLTKQDMDQLQKEVTHEPAQALFGGEDGLDFYRDITRAYMTRLNNNGMLAFEVGHTQAEEVMEILIQAGFEDVRAYNDYCGIKRAVIGFFVEGTNVKVY